MRAAVAYFAELIAIFLWKRTTARLFLNFFHNLTFEILIDKSDSRFAVLYIC